MVRGFMEWPSLPGLPKLAGHRRLSESEDGESSASGGSAGAGPSPAAASAGVGLCGPCAPSSSSSSPCGGHGGHLACCGICAAVVAAAWGIVALLLGEKARQPTWEVTNLTIDYIDIPGLMLKGVVPADTSKCPLEDLCGMAQSKGCSVCPEPNMWNDGCICRKDAQGHSAPAGMVVSADTSRCPSSDPCGVGAAEDCSSCPDASWINEGCACRQPPMSPKDFFKNVGDFLQTIAGLAPTLVKMGIRSTVQVFNPTDMGATAESGSFNITYRGTVIGSAVTHPAQIGAKSSVTISAHVKVDNVPEQIGLLMLQDILNNHNQLSVQAHGTVPAACGPFRIICSVVCDLVADVSVLPQAKFTRKACEYDYRPVTWPFAGGPAAARPGGSDRNFG